MGMYFNPSNMSFKQAANSPIYVDKTGLVKCFNRALGSEGKCVALSHARRFGKSQAAGMLKAYYSKGCDSRELFSKFAIAKTEDWDKYLNKLNVIHLDMSTFAGNYQDNLIEMITTEVYEEIAKEYPSIDFDRKIASVLGCVYQASGAQFVIIIDEWDCVIRNQSDRPDLVHRYMQFLHDIFKSEEAKDFLALGYITGILPIKKIEDESALNNFREYTMLSSKQLTPYFGFTEDEVKALCRQYGMEFESVKAWYNGYLIDGRHMYNPNSVYQSMLDSSLESYWKNTSAFSTINKYIALNFDGLKDDIMTVLAGGKIKVDPQTFRNDLKEINSKDDALTALIHLGYLAYDAERRMAYLPNYEVATAYEAALKTGNWQEIAKSVSKCDELMWATIDGEADTVAELVELAHETYTSVLKYNDENSLSCVLTMAYFTAPAYYNIVREFPAGKGYADMVLIPRRDSGNKPAIVIELKWNKDADAAIRQIKEKRYAGELSGYTDKILLVGIIYDKETKHHECVIEEY